MKLTEYDISYAVKEYLYDKKYTVITWNPPGSQGTFTIPNPDKDPTYKGQTGSESPDLIAFNSEEIVFVEAKDSISKSYSDIEKLIKLLSNNKRRELLFRICTKQMEALEHKIDLEKLKIKIGVAVPYAEDIKNLYDKYENITIYSVKCNFQEWNNKIIDAGINMKDIFKIQEEAI